MFKWIDDPIKIINTYIKDSDLLELMTMMLTLVSGIKQRPFVGYTRILKPLAGAAIV